MPFSFKPNQATSAPAPAEEEAAPTIHASVPLSTSPLSQMRIAGGKISLIQIGLFVVCGLLAIVTVVLFIYSYYLTSQVEVKKAKLATYEKNLSGFPLEDMRKLSNRLKIINRLIKEHPSVNAAFRVIEDSVEFPVTYTRFDLKAKENAKAYDLALGAIAPDYRSVVQQLDTFKRKPYSSYISNVSLEGLHPDDTGRVIFTLKMGVAIAGVLPEDLTLQTVSDTSTQVLTQPQQTITASTTIPMPTTPVDQSGPPAVGGI